MSRTKSAAKVKLSSFDDLFGVSEVPQGTEQIQEIPLDELYDFKGHPFRVMDDEKMEETVESVRQYGVLVPGIVRRRTGGGYEMISGHRRKHACELAGMETMPVFIRDYEVEKGISNFFEIYGISLTESDKMCRPYICRILRNVRQDRGLIRAPCCRILL